MSRGDSQTETRSPARVATSELSYRPHLDGLRTVAVYLVVAFHAGLGVMSGGFIGVDIFFVLSGFLVTQILLRGLKSVGRIRGRDFYSRRVRRILPAAIVTLVVTAIAYSIVATPAEMLDALGGFKASFLYVANWYFIQQSADYFAANVNSNPVLHFWSLAIEEQFYLVWPLVLAGLYLATARLQRWRWWTLRAAIIGLGAVSAILALHVAQTDLTRAYYGTDTRAYQLLAGAALALTPQLLRLGSRWRGLASGTSAFCLAGLVLLATSVISVGPITRGVMVAVLTVALLTMLENAPGGAAKEMLSSRPFTYLGRISYGVYLWHWPVIVIADHGRDLSPITLFVLACVIATILAALSYRFIEQPIRMSATLSRYKLPVIAIGFTSSILIGLLLMPAILDRNSGTVAASPGTGRSPSGLKLLDWRVAKNDRSALPNCLGKPVERCTIVNGTGKRVLLMGDSNAWAWIPTFTELAKQRNWSFSVAAHPTCPWQEHLQVLFTSRARCQAAQKDWYERVIPTLDPDLIILSHQGFDDPARGLPFINDDGKSARPGTPEVEAMLRQASVAAIRTLKAPGRQIIILEPIPNAPQGKDPLSCLSVGTAVADCAYQAEQQPTPLERFYRAEAAKLGFTSLDLDRLVCPRWPTCDAVVGDIIVKRDVNHLTGTFARSLVTQIGALIPK